VLPTVPVPPKRLDDYREAAGDDAVERLREAARPLRGLRLLQLNSTAFGGGVAELLFTHVPLLNDLGIRTTWHTLEGSPEFFTVTKFAHNGLQGAEVPWTEDMEQIYLDRMRHNAKELTAKADATFVHDGQGAALITLMEEEGRRRGCWIWRCHVDLSAPDPEVWGFFAGHVARYDAAVFTMKEYAQPGLTGPRIAIIPPSIDPLSAKNIYVDDETVYGILHRYGIDRQRHIVTQVSRFDQWKDPVGVIEAFRRARKEVPEVQLVLVGSMAHDDPEGWHYLELTASHRDNDPDIYLLTNFEQVGNLEVNALQRASSVVLQKSIREGFGLTVAEAMWKERPVIGGAVGGIRLQIEDGKTGFLVDSVEDCAARIADLLRDDRLRSRMGRAARRRVAKRFLTLRELEDHVNLLASLT
jgi:trehalose synthase